ncbi:MAG: hypothetical protein VW683_08325 [Betaproteobacteria bacterium]
MGYRSQVVLAISKELIPFLMLATSKNKEAEALVFRSADTFDRDYGGDKSWFLHWDCIKWYESYPDVDAIEKFVSEAECDEYNITDDDGNEVSSSDLIRFVRVGEDNDDIEVRGNGFWDIHPVTSIVW